MISDVPLGVMLSGGLDSSLIAALMAEQSAPPGADVLDRLRRGRGANELGDAERVAKRLGTEHHELMTSAIDHPELLDEALWHLEEPDRRHVLPRLPPAEPAGARDVTVALSGQGADELLGGYRKHQIAALRQRLGPRAAPAPRARGRAARGRPPGRRPRAASSRSPPTTRSSACSR